MYRSERALEAVAKAVREATWAFEREMLDVEVNGSPNSGDPEAVRGDRPLAAVLVEAEGFRRSGAASIAIDSGDRAQEDQMQDDPRRTDTPDAEASAEEPYEPPTAEDVDKTHAPHEASPGVADTSPRNGG